MDVVACAMAQNVRDVAAVKGDCERCTFKFNSYVFFGHTDFSILSRQCYIAFSPIITNYVIADIFSQQGYTVNGTSEFAAVDNSARVELGRNYLFIFWVRAFDQARNNVNRFKVEHDLCAIPNDVDHCWIICW